MTHEELKASLVNIKKQMADALAEPRHDVLSDIIENVTTLPESGEEDHKRSDLVRQLEELEAEFEVEHPNLAVVIRQTIDILNKMGI